MSRSRTEPSTAGPTTLSAALPTLLLIAVLAASSGLAGDSHGEPFTKARFDVLQSEGALILVDVAAPWCPTCARQADLVSRYRAEHPDVPLHVLRVDFDGQKEWVRFFGAPRQSTLLLFKGEERVWFSVGETREPVVFAAIDEAADA